MTIRQLRWNARLSGVVEPLVGEWCAGGENQLVP